jgi:hypothetical protein
MCADKRDPSFLVSASSEHSKRKRESGDSSEESTVLHGGDISRSCDKQYKISKMILQDDIKSSIGRHSSLINKLNAFIPQLAQSNQSLGDQNRLDLDLVESISSSESDDGESSDQDEETDIECSKIEFNLGLVKVASPEDQTPSTESKKPTLIQELSSDDNTEK